MTDDPHGIESEPHLTGQTPQLDPSEAQAEKRLEREWEKSTLADHVEHNVWEEPALANALTEPPAEGQLTYQNWLEYEFSNTSTAATWLITAAVVLLCGPLGIVGALFAQLNGGIGMAGAAQLIGAVIMAPLTEELTKIALALWIVEKRPAWFSSIPQILIASAAGGLTFAAIENLIYLYIYVPDHSAAFTRFRWTVCVGLHVGCSITAGIGLASIWEHTARTRERPNIARGVPWFLTAMVAHGCYNAAVVIAELLGWLDFLQE